MERVRLPFPVSFRQLEVFTTALFLMVVISKVPFVAILSPVVRYLMIPGLIAWYLTKQRLDGKPPLRWLLSWIRFALSPKRLNRLCSVRPTPERMRFKGSIGYRIEG